MNADYLVVTRHILCWIETVNVGLYNLRLSPPQLPSDSDSADNIQPNIRPISVEAISSMLWHDNDGRLGHWHFL